MVIGIYLALTAIGDGYSAFVIGAPIAAFLTGCLFWKMMVKEKSSRIRVVFTGILTVIFSHYLTFVLINIGANICYWTTGNCTDSFGEPPANFILMLGGAFIFSFFSLLFFGWLAVSYAIVTRLILKRMENKTNVA